MSKDKYRIANLVIDTRYWFPSRQNPGLLTGLWSLVSLGVQNGRLQYMHAMHRRFRKVMRV